MSFPLLWFVGKSEFPQGITIAAAIAQYNHRSQNGSHEMTWYNYEEFSNYKYGCDPLKNSILVFAFIKTG